MSFPHLGQHFQFLSTSRPQLLQDVKFSLFMRGSVLKGSFSASFCPSKLQYSDTARTGFIFEPSPLGHLISITDSTLACISLAFLLKFFEYFPPAAPACAIAAGADIAARGGFAYPGTRASVAVMKRLWQVPHGTGPLPCT